MEQESAKGRVFSLSSLVGYQDGAVVSKTLYKHETGSVTLFAFDKGQSLSEHTVPHDAMVQVLDGEAEITISGKMHRLKSGEMIVMPGDEPHAVSAPARFKMILTMMRR